MKKILLFIVLIFSHMYADGLDYKKATTNTDGIELSFYEGVINNKVIGLVFAKFKKDKANKYRCGGYFVNASDKKHIFINGDIEKDNISLYGYEHEFIGKISNKEMTGRYKHDKVSEKFNLKKVTRKSFFEKFDFLNIDIPKKIVYEYKFGNKANAPYGLIELIKLKETYKLRMFRHRGAPSYNLGHNSADVKLKNNIITQKRNKECSYVIFIFNDTARVLEKGDSFQCEYGYRVTLEGLYDNIAIIENDKFDKKLKNVFTILKDGKDSDKKIKALDDLNNFAITVFPSRRRVQPAYIEALKGSDTKVILFAIEKAYLDEESVPLLLNLIINNPDARTSAVLKLDNYFGCNGCDPKAYGYLIDDNIILAKKAYKVLKDLNIGLTRMMDKMIYRED